MQSVHQAVLLHEVVQGFALEARRKKQEESSQEAKTSSSILHSPYFPIYLDGTLGGAGHAMAIAKALDGQVNVIGLDRDQSALDRAKESLKVTGQVILECQNFRSLDVVLQKHGVKQVDYILFDLGISSDELEHSGRGFSFMNDEPLLMTMGDPASYPFTARDILNRWTEEDIANVIFGYGEERYARRIARSVIAYRAKKPIETTGELTEIIKGAVPPAYRHGKLHPATKTFQALRIAVNDELAALREGLAKGYDRLAPGGRIAVISFHSLEDRIAKEFFKHRAGGMNGIILTKKPLTASDQEIAENPRSRSAKLRILEKGN